MVVAIVEKITENSPLHFSLDRNVNVFDSNANDHFRTNWIKSQHEKLLTHIVSLKIVSATLVKRTLPQYSDLLTALT